jgi:hypothetical protein
MTERLRLWDVLGVRRQMTSLMCESVTCPPRGCTCRPALPIARRAGLGLWCALQSDSDKELTADFVTIDVLYKYTLIYFLLKI